MTRPTCPALFSACLLVALLPTFALAQQNETTTIAGIEWQVGPTVGKLGTIAEINIPEGFGFTGKPGAKQLLELTENPSSGSELGAIIPLNRADDADMWFVVFEYNRVGYIRDDERDELDADALLKSIREGTEASNEYRRERGWAEMHILGWARQPFYDQRTNNLTWAIRGETIAGGERHDVINYSVRLLGRGGYMNMDLVLSPAQLDSTLPEYNALADGFGYVQGQQYAEFRKGDKLAAYGLTALIVGGAGAAAAKAGLLQKFWKLIVLGVIAIGAFLKRIWKRIFGSKDPLHAEQGAIPPG